MIKVLFKRKTSDEIATLPVEDGALIYNYETGATYLDYGNERIPTGGGMPTGDTFPIGAITSYAGDTAPVNWLICDGSAISRTTYADLFNAIGTTYGAGDGSTTFNLPNLKGRVITGLDSSQTEFDALGETGGEKTHTLTINEMPSHNHSDFYQVKDGLSSPNAGGTYANRPMIKGNDASSNTTFWNTADAGENQPHNNLQPYVVLNYIIKAFQSAGTVASVTTTTTTSDTDTYSCNYINQNNTYSTSETLTGKIWIDGKPIYRKCITLSNVNIGYVEQNHGISNVDNLISMVGTLEYNDKIQYIPNVVCDNIAGYGAGFVDFKKSGTFHTLFGTSISTTNTVHVIFEYTKTTD